MNVHERASSLAAIDLDFPLAAKERSELEDHLAACADCRRLAVELRSDATALHAIAAVAPPARLRTAIATAAARPDRIVWRFIPDLRPFLRLAMVASLVAALMVGLLAVGLIGVGNRGGPDQSERPSSSARLVPERVVVDLTLPICKSASAIVPDVEDVLAVCPAGLDRIPLDGSPSTRLATGVAAAVLHDDAIWAVGTDALVELDRTTGAPRGSFSQAGGDALAVGAGSVWVVATNAGTVTRLDLVTHKVLARIAVGRNPEAIIVAEGQVWVSNRGSNSVSRIDPETNTVGATIPVEAGPLGIAAAGRWIWVADNGAGVVSRIDPARDEVDRVVAVAPASDTSDLPAIATMSVTSLWVVDGHAQTLVEIDPQAAAILRDVSLPGLAAAGDEITAMAIDGRGIWVAGTAGTLRVGRTTVMSPSP